MCPRELPDCPSREQARRSYRVLGAERGGNMSQTTRWSIAAIVLAMTAAGTAMAGGLRAAERLEIAIFERDLETIERLIASGVELNPRPGTDTPPLVTAAAQSSPEVVGLLIEHGAEVNPRVDRDNPRSPLHHAGNRFEIARRLLAAGADANAEAGVYGPPLYQAANTLGDRPPVSFEAGATIRLLLEYGADVHYVAPAAVHEGFGCAATPLHLAARSADTSAVEILIRHGADAGVEDHEGSTALECARQQLESVNRWISNATTADIRQMYQAKAAGLRASIAALSNPGDIVAAGRAPAEPGLLRAVEDAEVEVARAILDHGGPGAADAEQLKKSFWIALRREYFDLALAVVDLRPDLDHLRIPGTTILTHVLPTGRADLVEALLERGADPNARGRYGTTELWSALTCERCVRLLLDHGADPESPDKQGCTVLTKAAGMGAAGVVEMLLDAGADPAAACYGGDTNPLAMARDSGSRETVELLRQALGKPAGAAADAGMRSARPEAGGGDLFAQAEAALRLLEDRFATPSAATADFDLDLLAQRLEDHLASRSDDVDALVLLARLTLVSPFAARAAEEQRAASPEATARALFDRALELDPDHAGAHHGFGLLYLERGIEGEMGYATRPEALDSAISQFRLAVELAPGEIAYREALARALAARGRPGEAAEALASADPSHPMLALLSDLDRVPMPDEARYLDSHILTMDYLILLAESGREDHLDLRLRIYEIHAPAEDVMSFYRRHWPGFRFLASPASDPAKGERQWHQFLRFKGGSVRFTDSFGKLPRKLKKGLQMTLLQFDVDELPAAIFPRAAGQPACFLMLINWR